MPHLHRDVQRRARPLQRVQVAAEVVPAQVEIVLVLGCAGLEQLFSRAQQRRAEAGSAVACQLQRHALAYLTLGGVVEQKRHVAVGVQVDEARRDDKPGCVNALCGLAIQAAYRRYLVAEHAHVRLVGGAAGAVDNAAVLD